MVPFDRFIHGEHPTRHKPVKVSNIMRPLSAPAAGLWSLEIDVNDRRIVATTGTEDRLDTLRDDTLGRIYTRLWSRGYVLADY